MDRKSHNTDFLFKNLFMIFIYLYTKLCLAFVLSFFKGHQKSTKIEAKMLKVSFLRIDRQSKFDMKIFSSKIQKKNS